MTKLLAVPSSSNLDKLWVDGGINSPIQKHHVKEIGDLSFVPFLFVGLGYRVPSGIENYELSKELGTVNEVMVAVRSVMDLEAGIYSPVLIYEMYDDYQRYDARFHMDLAIHDYLLTPNAEQNLVDMVIRKIGNACIINSEGQLLHWRM